MEQPTMENMSNDSEERLKFVRENNKLKKQIEMFQKNEEQLSNQTKTMESKVDILEEEKYRLLEEISSLKCDLNIKDTEIKRLTTKLNQMRDQCQQIEEKYLKQKEKLHTIVSSEKEFFKGLQEVIDYFYESVVKYSKYTTRLLCKLMVNEPVNIQHELKDEFESRANGLKILSGNINIPVIKMNKQAIIKNLQQRVTFFNDIEFDKTQLAFDKLLEEMKSQGVKLEINDMTLLMDGDRKSFRSLNTFKNNSSRSIYDTDASYLNDSIGDANNNTMLLADLDRSDNNRDISSASTRTGSFNSLGDHLNAIKGQIKTKIDEAQTPDFNSINKVLKEMSDLVDFINTNVDMGQSDKSKGPTPKANDNHRQAQNFSADIDIILDDVESKAGPEIARGLVNRIKDKMNQLKEHSSVRTEDLVALEKLLDRKDEVNFEWNKLEIFQQRLNKKINFLAEFIKDKEQMLQDKKVNLDKAQILHGELVENINSLMRELRDVEEERKDVESEVQQIKKQKLTLIAKIDLNKKEITKIRTAMSAETLKVQNFTEDLNMLQNDLNMNREKQIKLVQESEKLEKKVQTFNTERNQGLEAMFRLEIDDLLLNEKRNIISTMTKVSESTSGTPSTVFFSLKDLHGSVSSSEQIPQARKILEKKIQQILEIIDKVENKESAKDIIVKHQDSIQLSYTFGPFFILFYRSLLMMFYVSLRFLDEDESKISLLKTLNESLLNTQLFGQNVNSWEAIAKMRNKIFDFQLEIKNSLSSLVPK